MPCKARLTFYLCCHLKAQISIRLLSLLGSGALFFSSRVASNSIKQKMHGKKRADFWKSTCWLTEQCTSSRQRISWISIHCCIYCLYVLLCIHPKKTRLLQNTYVLFIEQWNYIMLLDIRYSMCTIVHIFPVISRCK